MGTFKFTGRVGTSKVGSDCEFEFEIDEEDLPEDPKERKQYIDDVALDALWQSGIIDWGYDEVNDEEQP